MFHFVAELMPLKGAPKRVPFKGVLNRVPMYLGYYGWYSNRMRGDRDKREMDESLASDLADPTRIDIRSYKPKRIPQLMWRECTPRELLSGRIKQIWEVDPLHCTHCGGEMKIIGFIYEHAVIRKILVHLKIYKGRVRLRAPPIPLLSKSKREYETFDDGWPGFSEPVIDFNAI